MQEKDADAADDDPLSVDCVQGMSHPTILDRIGLGRRRRLEESQ